MVSADSYVIAIHWSFFIASNCWSVHWRTVSTDLVVVASTGPLNAASTGLAISPDLVSTGRIELDPAQLNLMQPATCMTVAQVIATPTADCCTDISPSFPDSPSVLLTVDYNNHGAPMILVHHDSEIQNK